MARARSGGSESGGGGRARPKPAEAGDPAGAPQEKCLSRRIEELALAAVEADPQAPGSLRTLSEGLAGVEEQAQRESRPDIAGMASALKEKLDSYPGDADLAALSEALKQGVSELQTAIGRDAEVTAEPQPRSAGANALLEDVDLVAEIVTESREHLSALEGYVLALESDPGDSEAIHAAFRSFHTIKGLAGFLELKAIQQVAHEIENVLDRARNGTLAITPAAIDLVLSGRDYLARAFDGVERVVRGETAEAEPDNSEILERIASFSEAVPEDAVESAVDEPAAARDEPEPGAAAAVPEDAIAAGVDESAATREESQPGAAAASAAPAAGGGQGQALQAKRQVETRTIKVDTGKLDYLMDMVGEMVIAQSQIHHDPELRALDSPRLQRNLAQLARTTNELQRTAMSLRMEPIGQLFRRMLRLVRDLSRKAGKQAVLELSGEDTELDRTIVEELSDPLIHMIRNSLDHGLETPEERRAAGKDPVGHIRLRAAHQAGHILVEISDDGRGINRDKVLAKARDRGLVAADAILSDAEVFALIFEPGFSTADRVSDVSGRGVGMDVVRKHIQKLRGRIEVQSSAGQGTTFLLKLPLTLAILDGLVIGVGGERYIVPLFAVREIFRPTSDMISKVEGAGET
ncbi:MAG: chemotaxis protein CheA, partial [bacterium]